MSGSVFNPLFLISVGLLTLAVSQVGQTQVDPSSAILLNGVNRSSRDSGLDTGRYTVRPRDGSSKTTRRSQAVADPNIVDPDTLTSPKAADSGHVRSTPNGVNDKLITTENADSRSDTPSPAATATAVPPVPPATQLPPSATTTPKPVAGLRRFNLIDLSVAPGYVYNNAQSSFIYRRYLTSAPSISADATAWFNENFGVNGSYLTTMSGSVADSNDRTRNTAADQQWTTFGVRGRRYFSFTPEASALVLGVDYYEYKFKVPNNAGIREKLTSTGVRISVEGEFPSGPSHTWLLGVSFMPKLSHTEASTSISFKSGDHVNANAVGFSVGSRWQFDRSNAVFWKFSYLIEKDLFGGPASITDPVANEVPAGVSVTNSFSLIQIGYSWGN